MFRRKSSAYCNRWKPFFFLLATSLLMSIAITTSASGISGRYDIPLRYDPLTDQSPIVYVRVNSSPPLPFVLDTGCSPSIYVCESLAKKMHLKPKGEKRFGLSTQTGVPLQSISLASTDKARSLLFRSRKQEELQALILRGNMSMGLDREHLSGIVGLAFLRKFAFVCFDFHRHVLILDTEGASQHPSSVPPIPMTLQDDHVHIQARIDEVASKNAIVDTGASTTIIALQDVSRPLEHLLEAAEFDTLGGTTQSVSALLSSMEIGGTREANVRVDVGALKATFIGMNLLTRFRITFDFKKLVIYLERSEDYAERSRPLGRTLITLERKNDHVYINRIDSYLSEQQIDLREGDEILSVDGRPAGALTTGSVQRLINGYEDSVAHVVRRRNLKIESVEYLREKLGLDSDQTKRRRNVFLQEAKQETFPCGGMIFPLESDGMWKRGIPVTPGGEASWSVGAVVFKYAFPQPITR